VWVPWQIVLARVDKSFYWDGLWARAVQDTRSNAADRRRAVVWAVRATRRRCFYIRLFNLSSRWGTLKGRESACTSARALSRQI
jgi:hypothetical protein